MNYVPGTASLIDDIDSKLERRVRSLEHSDGLVGNRFKMWHRVCVTQTGSLVTCNAVI